MISVKKEKMIRSLLASGRNTKTCIAKVTGVSTGVIHRISKLPTLRKRRVAHAPSRFSGIPRISKPRRCDSCGAFVDIWPCLICHPNNGMPERPCPALKPRIIGATNVLKDNMTELIRISQDILNISALQIECFSNPLFRSLADRSRRVLRKINVREGEFIDIKFD